MDWQIASDIATTISALILVVSIVFIWLQLRQQTKLAKWANAQAMSNLIMNFNMELLRDKNLAGLWRNGNRDYKKYDESTKEQYESLLSWWLILYETMTYLVKQDLLDANLLALYDKDFTNFVETQLLREFWERRRTFYMKEFSFRVDTIILQHKKENRK